MNTEENLSAHPAAGIFPEMPPEEFEELKDDIANKGLQQEIVRYEGQILDGRHRYRACLETGVAPRFRDHDGGDPIGYVLSANVRRRHLNSSQRAMVAAQVADMPQGGDRSKAQICGLTHEQAAKQLNVSPRLIDKASALLNKVTKGRALPEIAQAVNEGKMRLERAAKISSLPIEEQKQALSAKAAAKPARDKCERDLDRVKSHAERSFSLMKQVVRRASMHGMTPRDRKALQKTWSTVVQWMTDVGALVEKSTAPVSDPGLSAGDVAPDTSQVTVEPESDLGAALGNVDPESKSPDNEDQVCLD